MENKTKPSLSETLVGVLLLFVGLCVAHLGVTLFLLTDLGSDPFNVLIQGLNKILPGSAISHGQVHLAVSLLILLILLIVDRHYIGIGTVICMALGGPIIDLFSALLSPFINSGLNMAVRIALLVAGCFILAFGMTIVICSKAGTGPNDLVAVVLSEKLKLPFGPTRMAVDLLFTVAGVLMGGTFGLGTLICAFIVGPAAQLFFPISRALQQTAVQKFCKDKF